MRRLDGARAAGEPRGRMEGPLEVERAGGPALAHQRDALLDALAAVAPIRLERLVILERAAAPDAHVEPAAADHVQHGELLGEIHRVMERQETHPHAEAEGPGAGGDERR